MAALSPEQQKLFGRIPPGWARVDRSAHAASDSFKQPVVPDADGVVARSEQDHRRIYQPYSSTSPFAASTPVQDRAKRKGKGNDGSGDESGSNSGSNNNSAEPEGTNVFISRTFSFGHFGPLYHWMARVGAMADHYQTYPHLDWFFMEVTAAVPLTTRGLHLAWYMTDEEAVRGIVRNISPEAPQFRPNESLVAPSAGSDASLTPEMRRQIEEHALGQFCWVIAGDAEQRDAFTGDIYLQWYHRADYLVGRKAKEAAEYRNNLTLSQLMQSASQNRKRRKQRAEEMKEERARFQPMPDADLPPQFLRFKSKGEREAIRNMQLYGMDGRDGSQPVRSTSEATLADLQEMTPSRHQFVIDTLPREVRESLDADDTFSGLGGGVRQQDPLNMARAGSMPAGGGSSGGGGGGTSGLIHSGGSWHM